MSVAMAGLGIDFNPPLSPPSSSLNPAIARLQGRGAQRRPLPHVPVLRNAISLDNFPTGYYDRKVRIAQDSPEVIYGHHVEEDYGDSDDERYMDDDVDLYHSDVSPPAPPFIGMSKSISYNPAALRTVHDLRRTMPAQLRQRPHSMMELAHLYARQAPDSSEELSPSLLSESDASPIASSATSVSPSDLDGAKVPVQTYLDSHVPSQQVHSARPPLQRTESSESRFIEDIQAGQPAPVRGAAAPLARQGTLLSNQGVPSRKQRELNRLLAPGTTLKRKSSVVVLEQAGKGRARVELDVVLASSLVVEGGVLKGRMEVVIKDGAREVWVSNPKARVVGFEELATPDMRHVFYHHAAMVETGDETRLPHTSSAADAEGFYRGMPGKHSFPFQLHLPVDKGAKGPLKSKNGTIRYIVIGSMKLKAKDGSDRSIAHFYRHLDVFPYCNPALVLASSVTPHVASVDKSLFMGGAGKVYLTASVHRLNWVAGQRCYVDIVVKNDTTKKIKTLSFALVRTMLVFQPKQDVQSPDLNTEEGPSETHRKKVAEETLEMGKKGARGEVTAKGLWMGVEKGETVEFSHSLPVPAESLSIARGRHLEVGYVLKVSLGAGPLSSDVSVELPIRVINFLSIDPPPGHRPEPVCSALPSPLPTLETRAVARPWHNESMPTKTASHLDRVPSMDSLQIADLNAMYRARPLLRTDSGASSESTASAMSLPQQHSHQPQLRHLSAPSAAHAANDLLERARDRQLKHQMSLECIGNAIASATARRLGRSPTTSALREEVTMEDEGSRPLPPLPVTSAAASLYATPEDIQLDDIDDEITSDYEVAPSEVEYEDESEDEVDAVMRNFALEERLTRGPAVVVAPPPSSPARSKSPSAVVSPARATPKSPTRAPARSPARPTSASKSPRTARVATPSSPIKRSPTAPAPLDNIATPSRARSGPLATQRSSPTKVTRIPPPAVTRARVLSPTSPPDLLDSASSSPSTTEDARTPPTLSLPPMAAIAGQKQQLRGVHVQAPAATYTAKVAPGVRKRVTALETRQSALRAVTGIEMTRQASITSTISSAFGGVDRNETPRFQAPIFRR